MTPTLPNAIRLSLSSKVTTYLNATNEGIQSARRFKLKDSLRLEIGEAVFDALQKDLAAQLGLWAARTDRECRDAFVLGLLDIAERIESTASHGESLPVCQEKPATPLSNVTLDGLMKPILSAASPASPRTIVAPSKSDNGHAPKPIKGKQPLRGGLESSGLARSGKVVTSFRELARCAERLGFSASHTHTSKEYVMVNQQSGARIVLPHKHGGSGSDRLPLGTARKCQKMLQQHASV